MQRRIESILCVALGIAGLVGALATPQLISGYNAAQPYYLKSAFFPWVALSMVAGFGTWAGWQAWRGIARTESDEVEAGSSGVALALAGAALFAGGVILSLAVGYAAATWIMLVILGSVARISLRARLVLATVLSLILYAIFVVGFKVWFPPSWLAGWLQ